MKRTFIKLCLFVFLGILIGTGCEKEEDLVVTELDFKKVKGLSLSGDTCFIPGSDAKDFDLVINSQEEFEKYFESKSDFIPQIDFSQYTLFAGSRRVNCIYPELIFEKVLLDEKSKSVQLLAQFEFDSGCYNALGTIYFHALVPKLKQTYQINFDIDVIGD